LAAQDERVVPAAGVQRQAGQRAGAGAGQGLIEERRTGIAGMALAVESHFQEAAGALGFPNRMVAGIAPQGDGAAGGVEEQPHRKQDAVLHHLEARHEALPRLRTPAAGSPRFP
jgi:hypothetical protein